MTASINPDRILKELANLWVTTGKEAGAESGAGVLRACSMTLVVLAEESEDTQILGETLAALMPEHPARTILIRLSGAGQRALSERVYSQCWMPFGQRRQICCEQVEITASDAALADLPFLVLPLAVPDLPLILWCRATRLTAMPQFWRIAAMAQKIVMDSGPMENPLSAIALMAAVSQSGVLLGDLSWTRLTRWREMLAQMFQNQQNLAQLSKIAKLELQCGALHQVSGIYMMEWLRTSLDNAGVTTSGKVGTAPAGISLRVDLSGAGFSASLERQDERLVVTVNGVSQCTNLTQPTDYLLMREELGIARHDPVFESTLASASRLAYPTDQ